MSARYVVDDFGLSESVDRAALELATAGAIHAVSVLATRADEMRTRVLASLPSIAIGLHLDLTEGPLLAEPRGDHRPPRASGAQPGLSRFVFENGRFVLEPRALVREVRAQADRLRQIAGRIDYVDGHEHVQALPWVYAAIREALGDLPVRLAPLAHVDSKACALATVGRCTRWLHPRGAHTADRVLDFEREEPAHDVTEREEAMLHVAHPALPDRTLDKTSYGFPNRARQFARRMRAVSDPELGLAVERGDLFEVDAYVAAHPHSTFAHAPGYRSALLDAYGLRPVVISARRNGRVVGAALWTAMMSPFGSRYLALGPFASYADVLGDCSATRERLILESARVAAADRRGHLLLRSRFASDDLSLIGCTENELHRFVAPRIELEADLDTIWREMLDARARNTVRKARKLAVRVVEVGDDLVDFQAVFDRGMRDLGSPFHGHNFFAAVRRHLGAAVRAWVAYAGARPAAAALAIAHRDVLHYVWGQNVHALRSTAANSLLLWTMIENAHNDGLSALDLGRSEVASTQASFKEQWGAGNDSIVETLIPVCDGTPTALRPTNPTFQWARSVWSTLPLPITRSTGSLLVRGIA